MGSARKVDVLQHQYAISTDGVLVTRGIWTCTAWYGWSSAQEVGFLCHLDHPFCSRAVRSILAALHSASGPNVAFRSYLAGGKRYLWSPLVRRAVRREVSRQRHPRVSVEDLAYDNVPWEHRGVLVDVRSGVASFVRTPGPTSPRGALWFFKRIQRVQ